ncbi:MAG: bifunctional pyr operon transcriptional regulator/uracil phosphoribosyltransferase PyrR [Dehalococcoidia bacterium]|nr:bifunctional pyr operon transcriptional regulator/uracil phosphoribosyltransferase PyrR [Dehalococcoidia bacterium]
MNGEQLLGPDEITRSLRRLAHEIVENNRGTEKLVLVGLLTRGYTLAHRLAALIAEFEGAAIPVGRLDIGLYRDDIGQRAIPPRLRPSEIPAPIDGATVVLVDDVLFTGRSIRAALDALVDFGRPARVRLAVLVDRGHRELPIRPDFVGKNIPTALFQSVEVRLHEVDGDDGVFVLGTEVTHARAQ